MALAIGEFDQPGATVRCQPVARAAGQDHLQPFAPVGGAREVPLHEYIAQPAIRIHRADPGDGPVCRPPP